MENKNKEILIQGVKIRDLGKEGLIDAINLAKSTGKNAQIITLNPEFIVEASRNKKFKEVINNAEYVTIDGVGIKLTMRLLFGKRLKRLTGVDLIYLASEYCQREEGTIFLLGAREGVAQRAGEALKARFPGLKIETDAGAPILGNKDFDDTNVVRHINEIKPDFLFVAYGAPNQDIWIAENLGNLKVKIACGVGGSFDYISGSTKRAPQLLRKLGLEWVFRLILEPRRIIRIFNAVIVFPYLVIKPNK